MLKNGYTSNINGWANFMTGGLTLYNKAKSNIAAKNARETKHEIKRVFDCISWTFESTDKTNGAALVSLNAK